MHTITISGLKETMNLKEAGLGKWEGLEGRKGEILYLNYNFKSNKDKTDWDRNLILYLIHSVVMK